MTMIACLISGYFYFAIGLGVAIGCDCAMISRGGRRYREEWVGAPRIVGFFLFMVFWPVMIASLLTMALAADADK